MKQPSLGAVGALLGTTSLVIALGSTGVAADAASLITGKEIKNSSVTGKDIKDGSLTKADLAPGTVTGGATGAAGAPGRDGAAVAARLRYAGSTTVSGYSYTSQLSLGSFTQGPNETILPMTVTATFGPQPTCPSGASLYGAGQLDVLIDGKVVTKVNVTYSPYDPNSTVVVPGFNTTGSATTHVVTAIFRGATCSGATFTDASATLTGISIDVARAS